MPIPTVGTLEVATDTSTAWQGVCVRIKNQSDVVVFFVAAKYMTEDQDPSSPGQQVRFAICTDQGGGCPSLIYTTGVELGSQVSCGTSEIGSCHTGTKVWINNQTPGTPDAAIDNKTGVSFRPAGSLQTGGPFVCVVVCVPQVKWHIGDIRLYVNSAGPVLSVPLCMQTGNWAPNNCPPFPS